MTLRSLTLLVIALAALFWYARRQIASVRDEFQPRFPSAPDGADDVVDVPASE